MVEHWQGACAAATWHAQKNVSEYHQKPPSRAWSLLGSMFIWSTAISPEVIGKEPVVDGIAVGRGIDELLFHERLERCLHAAGGEGRASG